MSMIEKVARALFEHQQFDADMVFDDFKDEYLAEARIAIEAMREPTEAMLKAGEIPTREISLGNGQTVRGLGLGAAPWSIWPKMIDAALAEET